MQKTGNLTHIFNHIGKSNPSKDPADTSFISEIAVCTTMQP